MSRYVVNDTETGNWVIYDGDSRKEAIETILEDLEGVKMAQWDLYENGVRIWCGKTDTENELRYMHRIRIGQQLADLRKERGLSGEQLAEKIGKCHQTVYKVERGAWAVSVDILEEFCDVLDAELVVRKKEG